MLSIFDRIKALKTNLISWDGSYEVADQFAEWVKLEKDIKTLLDSDGFQRLMSLMRQDFHGRLQEIISNDPELKAMKRMFVRTIGTQGAESEVTRIIDEIVDERGF